MVPLEVSTTSSECQADGRLRPEIADVPHRPKHEDTAPDSVAEDLDLVLSPGLPGIMVTQDEPGPRLRHLPNPSLKPEGLLITFNTVVLTALDC
jgi:hypothetical protein